MPRLAIVPLLLVLGGCVRVANVVGPDGSMHKLISCPSVSQCYEKAREVCGPYTIVNTSTSVSGSNGSTSSTTELLVKCN